MVYRLLSNPADRVFLQTNPDGMYMRYNGATLRAHQADVAELAGRGVARVVESRRPAGVEREVHAENESEQSGNGWRAQFGRETAGPNDFVNTDGLLIGDRPVVAKAQLMYRFPWGILASGNLQHQTGRFYSRGVRVSGLGFPAAPQINMEPNTGDRRVKDINLFDTRVQKTFTLPRSPVRFDVFIDALNLTNSAQYRVGRLHRLARPRGVRRRDDLHPATPADARRQGPVVSRGMEGASQSKSAPREDKGRLT